uniref:GST C-terminal domain-containing protein n=1 Tax=Globisporangium ultimum (strain ATCC 200006 / CBS 805.95 / DAOM BR144) TaxID=431595 RepID=K3X4Y0_GLOUD
MTSYRHVISTASDTQFPAEAGRYHLYITLSCPFACRALSALYLKGLDRLIDVSVAHPVFQFTKPDDPSDEHRGWTFADPATSATFVGFNGKEYATEGCIPDTVNHAKFVRDLYERVSPEPTRYTVPLLWDKTTQTIVSSESADMVRIFDTGFGDLAPNSAFAIIPDALKEKVDAMNDGLLTKLSVGSFKIAVAPKKATFEEDLARFFSVVQELEDLLATQRYLTSNEQITESDIRLFQSFLRVDYAQRVSSKYNLKDYPNIVNYLRDVYQIPEIKRTVYEPHLELMFENYGEYEIDRPAGPFIDYSAPHDRSGRF